MYNNKNKYIRDKYAIKTKNGKIITWISRYSIFQDGKIVENGLVGWKTALAHAEKYTTNLFTEIKKVEILNIWTGEIITIEEARRRAKAFNERINSATT